MNLDLSDVPESTQLAVARLVELSRRGHSGEVVVQLQDGGMREIIELDRTRRDHKDLRQLAARENGRG